MRIGIDTSQIWEIVSRILLRLYFRGLKKATKTFLSYKSSPLGSMKSSTRISCSVLPATTSETWEVGLKCAVVLSVRPATRTAGVFQAWYHGYTF